jgi:hypothetical protein
MSPVFDAGKPVSVGPGWGCSCPAYRHGEPTPEEAVKALDRAANVTVLWLGKDGESNLEFEAWTDPENRYKLTYGPGGPHGWCKHCVAALSHYAPWFRQLALGAGELLKENHELRKESRKNERRIERLETKLGSDA